MPRCAFGLCLIVTALAATKSVAWNDSGHLAIARLAWYRLSDRERAFFSKLLKHHPHYSAFLIDGLPAGVTEIEWAFCRAALWPDWLRDPRVHSLSAEESQKIRDEYHRSVWHYVNLPIIHSDPNQRLNPAEIEQRVLMPPVDSRGQPRHIVAALHYNLKRLKAPDLPESERAVALCWVLHLVGDVHQPLHSVALISSELNFEPPSGDQGANRIAIQVSRGDRRVQRLHGYWDSLPIPGRIDFQTLDSIVVRWLDEANRHADQNSWKLGEFLSWAEEGRHLARTVVYQHGGQWLDFKPLPTGPVDLDEISAPTLPSQYRQQSKKVARERQILAGVRLAGQLKEVAPTRP